MSTLKRLIHWLIPGRREIEVPDPEHLRVAFKSRYHQFRLLLSANNKALDLMSEMEEALKGTVPFGMHFVRSRCTRVSTAVFQIIKHLDELAPGKYGELFSRFKEIQKNINPFAYPRHSYKEGDLVIGLQQVDKDLADQVGSKMANLGEIRNRLHLKVPSGFVITAWGYQRFMSHNNLPSEVDRLIQATDVEKLDQLFQLSSAIQQRIIAAEVPEDMEKAMEAHYRELEGEVGEGVRVAMRSSALGEDLAGTSFAGQYRSDLNVSHEHLLQTYKEIIASKYGLSAMTYRMNRGIRDEDVAMCVGCLPMVDAVSGGVAYSRNPVNQRDDAAIINSVWGLPKPVVDGSTPTDLFVVSRGNRMEITRKEISLKDRKFVCYPHEGVCRLDLLDGDGDRPSLTDEKALEIARLVVRIEDYYGVAQDMEWAIADDGSVIVLQCRPLQQFASPEGNHRSHGEAGEVPVILEGGITASPGAAAGDVFLLRRDMEALQFPRGGVLVTAQALPRWAALMGRAAAIVAERGSVAGHLANVAREFRVPAIFGVKEALKKLGNGQRVTVDADGLRIYEGRVESLLKRDERPRTLMEGTPVYESLKGAAQYVIPLALLTPEAPSFHPRNCKSLHDITRFCHEKSIQEMFRFGKDHRFAERSSKQLVCQVPMQWWVLNLDDGFKEEVEDRFVHLENIVSIPMLAIWDGITRFPWEGPPPVDGKGFMAVMYQATTNTALAAGARSQYADRNYFMISRNYCCLTSRLGFHFSTIEALVGDRTGENYISFQFKGGAADLNRRYRRVLFIKELLEELGYRVDLRKDHLLARLEDLERDSMIGQLRIMGYLTIHTRQLDMIMANPSRVSYYRAKMNEEIQTLISLPGVFLREKA